MARVPRKRRQALTYSHVPEAHRLVGRGGDQQGTLARVELQLVHGAAVAAQHARHLTRTQV